MAMPLVATQMTKIVIMTIGRKISGIFFFAADIGLFYSRRTWEAWSCPHSPAIPVRHSWGGKGPILHVLRIPPQGYSQGAQDPAPEIPKAPEWVLLLSEACPSNPQQGIPQEPVLCCCTMILGFLHFQNCASSQFLHWAPEALEVAGAQSWGIAGNVCVAQWSGLAVMGHILAQLNLLQGQGLFIAQDS